MSRTFLGVVLAVLVCTVMAVLALVTSTNNMRARCVYRLLVRGVARDIASAARLRGKFHAPTCRGT